MTIQPIVEGHGEVVALPILVRRLIEESEAWPIQVGRPIRRPRSQLVSKPGVKQAVRLALIQPNCSAILVLIDGNSDCPATLGPTIQHWASEAAGGVPCSVVLAHREYEAWFLAGIESLRGHRGIRTDADPHQDPEGPRGAKEQLRLRMQPGKSYVETSDQPAFSAKLSLSMAYARSRSFRKLADSFAKLVRKMGHPLGAWPLPCWTADG